jgi:hypothetical protein
MRQQPCQKMAGILPHRLGHHQRRIRILGLEHTRSHPLSRDESVFEFLVIGVSPPHAHTLARKGLAQHALQLSLRGPAYLVGRLTHIAVGHQQHFVGIHRGRGFNSRHLITSHDQSPPSPSPHYETNLPTHRKQVKRSSSEREPGQPPALSMAAPVPAG